MGYKRREVDIVRIQIMRKSIQMTMMRVGFFERRLVGKYLLMTTMCGFGQESAEVARGPAARQLDQIPTEQKDSRQQRGSY